MSHPRHVPVRMCMGCGSRSPQPELLRIGWSAAGLHLVGDRPAGRNGYLHHQQHCWERFAARKGPLRSLGRAVDRPARLLLIKTLERHSTPAGEV